MTTLHTNKLVADYLRRLEQAAAPLTRSRRDELLAEIREHIDDALLEAGAADEVAVRNVLERLGPPEEIVAAAGPAQRRSGRLELAAMIALAIPFLGWFIGVVLVAASRAWTGREKAAGIAIVLVPALVLSLGLVAAGAGGGSTPVEAAPGSFPREQGTAAPPVSGRSSSSSCSEPCSPARSRRSTSARGCGERPSRQRSRQPDAASAVAKRSWARRAQ